MGGGSWTTGDYSARLSAKRAAGYATPFSHTEDISKGRKAAGVSDKLDPKIKAGDKSPHAGQVMRECMISDEHPNPTPIAVLFDVTGSMGGIPRVLQQKLPELQGLLQRKGYVEDPQILFGGIGDAFYDRAPLQVGQFESDNRADEQLEELYLEGGGGGGNHESYELALYFLARHTYQEPFEKEGKKGYAFIIGDERVYKTLNKGHVNTIIGDSLEETLTTRQVIAELQEKYHVFFLFAKQGSYMEGDTVDPDHPDKAGWGTKNDEVEFWKPLLGQNALILDDANAVCETIALTLGVMEGSVTLEDGMEDLKEIGADSGAVTAAGKALATVGATASPVATTTGALTDLDETDTGTERL